LTDEIDYQKLDKELDRVKTRVFLAKNAAFFGSLMTNLDFKWDEDCKTAYTNGIIIGWNPHYFLALSPRGRESIFMHELRHVAYLHCIRGGNRIHEIWNMAIDTILDNEMDHEGYEVDGAELFPASMFPPSNTFVNHKYDNMSAEEIYEIYLEEAITILQNPLSGDVREPTQSDGGAHKVVANVIQAQAIAMLENSLAGNLPGDVEAYLKNFLQPKLPWEQLLMQFFNTLSESDYSWARPNRRYQDIYLPSIQLSEGLDKINYYFDLSGSTSDQMVVRFNSEVKYIKDTFNPISLKLILFDTIIQDIIEYNQEDQFDRILIKGRGGTDLTLVREHIIEDKPDVCIIFTDMYVFPMEKLPYDIPIIWIVVNNPNAKVVEGKILHIKE
jgi:predicted metal-dependent peptidase